MDRLLEATARAERDHFWFHGFRRFVRPLLMKAAAGRSSISILDCGCGTGNNLTMLREYGRACGIDITFSGLAYARGRGERQVARASATCLPFAAEQFDLVTSFDVLYAFDDEMERDALTEMYRVLRRGGQILINVAALKSLTGNHSVLGGEVRRYGRRELADHLRRTGFTVRRITYTNFTLLPIVAGVRWSQRLRRPQGVHAGDDRALRPGECSVVGAAGSRGCRPARRQHAPRQFAPRPGPKVIGPEIAGYRPASTETA